jgi:multiple sugar transport system substrate-binding protein
MALMASSAASRFPAAIAADMGFFGFPRYSTDVPNYEEAPLDVLVMPAAARNPRARKRFLTFLAESGSLRQIAEADQTLSAQADATTRATLLGPATSAIWTGAAGLTYFFDRDATAELVAPAYEGMRRFLKPPHDTDQALRYIEQQRQEARRKAPVKKGP